MIQFQEISDLTRIRTICPEKEWKPSKKFKKQNNFVFNAQYQKFKLVAKYEKKLSWSDPEKIGKIFLGIIFTFFSFGIAYLYSKKIRKLFAPKQYKRFGLREWYYTEKSVEEKFKRKHFSEINASNQDLWLKEFKSQAKALIHTLNLYNEHEQDQNIRSSLKNKMKRNPTDLEVNAKKYELALNIILMFKNTLEQDCELPSTYISKQNIKKNSPHVRLLGLSCKGIKRVAETVTKIKETVQFLRLQPLDPGSFNKVYRVYSLEKKGPLIYRKMMKKDFENEDYQSSWKEEVRLHIQYQTVNPFIVPLHWVIKCDEKKERSLLLEFCDFDLIEFKNAELDNKVPNLTRLNFENAVYQLLQGVVTLHENGHYHSDLKPDNILVKKHTESPFYKIFLADFGLSEPLTKCNFEMRGTPRFLPYESLILDATKDQNQFAIGKDSFGLGHILYTLKNTVEDRNDHFRFCNGIVDEIQAFYGLARDNRTWSFQRFFNSQKQFPFAAKDIYHKLPTQFKVHQTVTELEVYRCVMENHFKEILANFYFKITEKLELSKDPFDHLIAGLLQFELEKRWTPQKSLEFLKNIQSKSVC